MAGEVVDTVVRLLELERGPLDLSPPDTGKEPLPGAIGWPDDDDHAKVADEVAKAGHPRVPEDVARHLADIYGMRSLEIARAMAKDPSACERIVPGRPEVMAQVDWAVREELAATLCDVMIRRTQLFYRDRDQGLGAAGRVVDRMAAKLDWDDVVKARELARYQDEVARSRAWREELATDAPAKAAI